MGATPEDTQREISRLRADMSAALEEVERRIRGGLRGAASTETRIGGVRAGEDAIKRARENPTLLGVAGVVAAGAMAYGVFALINALQAIDTTGIEPMSHAQDVTAPLRDDTVTETDRHADYQRVAPAVEDGLYLVPRVIE